MPRGAQWDAGWTTVVVLGVVGMYFTNMLYDPAPEKADPPAAGGAAPPLPVARSSLSVSTSYGATDRATVHALAPPRPTTRPLTPARLFFPPFENPPF